MHILVRSADLLQSAAIYLVIILMIRTVCIIYVLRSTQKALRATLFHECFLVIDSFIVSISARRVHEGPALEICCNLEYNSDRFNRALLVGVDYQAYLSCITGSSR